MGWGVGCCELGVAQVAEVIRPEKNKKIKLRKQQEHYWPTMA